ncbi:NirD/YgiW/YdeI family stress tolerance protein [Hydrogenovibrio thermophilus]|uniref:NirD/YgiW/YdeI family stress tolerance protein n=1 Tax=Hydrogenovibrio thermophilus TaxID=265883 RepID=A0A410H2I9_9GAMM|nr:NirD/YgiW/YdeI family stress tolerance protein [Hydrogenovibrio thermophilus]QAB15131.1 NirD/YgiW/YdeI family stress tolerance protein [Hydrogenovibrio thermophilus]
MPFRSMTRAAGFVGALLLSFSVNAAYVGPSSEDQPRSVKQILANPQDDQFVVLKGYLTQQVSSDKYIFKDDTGEIRVEIDHDLFTSDPIKADTLVEIRGEVEKDFLKTPEIDVDHLSIVKP